ncbi:MAG: hypothetical protein QW521_03380, partial [Desulfurococcaceae archaeon]
MPVETYDAFGDTVFIAGEIAVQELQVGIETYDSYGDAVFVDGEIAVQGPQQNIESYDVYGDAVFSAEITVAEEVPP